jgi:hypothetical protein
MARAFVKKLTGRDDTVMRFKMLHDAKDPTFHPIEGAGSLARVWPNLCAMQRDGYGVFYFLNEVRDMPNDEFAHASDVIAIRALAIDCDDGLPATYHRQPPIIRQWRPARSGPLAREAGNAGSRLPPCATPPGELLQERQ